MFQDMSIAQNLRQAIAQLSKNKIIQPAGDAEILLADVLKKPREFILAHREKQLTPRQSKRFDFLIKQRAKSQPVAYLLGYKEFYGLKFKVNKNVLIPRPESELIVDEILSKKPNANSKTIFIDLGTGSGCLLITLAKLLTKAKLFIATDISPKALNIAKQNAEYHKVAQKIKFIQGDLLKPLFAKNCQPEAGPPLAEKLEIGNCLEIRNPPATLCIALRAGWKLEIICNLPYLTPVQIKQEPSIQFEPTLALNGGPDGLKYYSRLARQINRLLKLFTNLQLTVYAEINPNQATAIKQIFKQAQSIQIKNDLAELSRLAIINY